MHTHSITLFTGRIKGLIIFLSLTITLPAFCRQSEFDDKKPILFILVSSDCPYCGELRALLDRRKDVADALHDKYQVNIIESRSEEGSVLKQHFGVRTVPSYIILEPDGKSASVLKGYSTPQKFATTLNLDYFPFPDTYFSNAVCGDGMIESPEECDDGNMWDGDGCSSICTVEPGFICTGEPSVCNFITTCGNGLVEFPEECDDGNAFGGDGCSSICTVEPGFICSGEPSACTFITTCGNGLVEFPEGCDDGNALFNDGCSPSCNVELGWYCFGSPSICIYVGYCGDGTLQSGEECDDGNNANNDGCSSTCKFEGPVNGVAINQDGTRAAPGAILDVKSTDKGILVPRMTTAQRTNISNPPQGLLVFDIDTVSFWFFNGTVWKEMSAN